MVFQSRLKNPVFSTDSSASFELGMGAGVAGVMRVTAGLAAFNSSGFWDSTVDSLGSDIMV